MKFIQIDGVYYNPNFILSLEHITQEPEDMDQPYDEDAEDEDVPMRDVNKLLITFHDGEFLEVADAEAERIRTELLS